MNLITDARSEPVEWLTSSAKGLLLHCHVQPRASTTGLDGLYGDPPRLRVRVAAPPIDDAANDAVIRFFKNLLDLRRDQISMVRGEGSRRKDILLTSVDVAVIQKRIEESL